MAAETGADGPRRNYSGPTTAVGHLYRQFSKRSKNKKNKHSRREPDPKPVTQEPTGTGTGTAAATSADVVDLLSRVRPALVADVVHAPPWLVADHFVSEHVAHEHVSVVPEPDHADPIRDDDHGAPPPESPASAVIDAPVGCGVPAGLSPENVSIILRVIPLSLCVGCSILNSIAQTYIKKILLYFTTYPQQ